LPKILGETRPGEPRKLNDDAFLHFGAKSTRAPAVQKEDPKKKPPSKYLLIFGKKPNEVPQVSRGGRDKKPFKLITQPGEKKKRKN